MTGNHPHPKRDFKQKYREAKEQHSIADPRKPLVLATELNVSVLRRNASKKRQDFVVLVKRDGYIVQDVAN